MWLLAVVSVMALSLWGVSVALVPTAAGPPEAPDPAQHPGAVVQVYGADVWGVRGRFAIHTWIATKARHADTYTIYQVIGWRLRRGQPVVSVTEGMPDQPWFRSPPVLLHQVTGPAAEALIDPIHAAVKRYPFASEYVMWPGPNSNSFIAWVALEVPQLGLNLPAKAIGSAWMVAQYPALKPGP